MVFTFSSDDASKKKQRYVRGKRLTIQKAATLLDAKSYKPLWERLLSYADLPDEHFDHFYLTFIHRFVEYVQVLPEAPNAYLGSLMTQGLKHGLNHLHLFVNEYADATPLERFAIFTASVLPKISTILTQQRVLITDDTGVTLETWQPFCGPMTDDFFGCFYKLLPRSNDFVALNKQITLTLIRQVLGERGFLWLASDLQLFTEWLSALDEDDEQGRSRFTYLIRRYRRMNDLMVDELPYVDITLLESPETVHGDAFYEWLQDGLQDGSIKVNTKDAHVHVTDAGLFIQPAIFKDFARLYLKASVNHYVVFTQFGNLMGVASKGGSDYLHAQMYSKHDAAKSMFNRSAGRGKSVEGVLVRDVKSVYGAKSPPEHSKLVTGSQAVRASHTALAAYNMATKPNMHLKNR